MPSGHCGECHEPLVEHRYVYDDKTAKITGRVCPRDMPEREFAKKHPQYLSDQWDEQEAYLDG